MEKTVLLSASGILFLIALAVFVFTYFYYHYANDKALFGRTYNWEPKKPLISMFFGILGTVLLASSIICLVFGLLL